MQNFIERHDAKIKGVISCFVKWDLLPSNSKSLIDLKCFFKFDFPWEQKR